MITLNKTDITWDIAVPKPEADIKINCIKFDILDIFDGRSLHGIHLQHVTQKTNNGLV